MTRPKIKRCHCTKPCTCCFKPQGVKCSKGIDLHPDELAALRLNDVDGFDQTKSAKLMGVSQPTFARILGSARKKMADAVINGKVLNLKEE